MAVVDDAEGSNVVDNVSVLSVVEVTATVVPSITGGGGGKE